MNKAEFKAINMIANKLGWQHKPVSEVVEVINQMVMNDQALSLDCCGECDDYEETLLSIATWDIDRIVSCLYTWDYTTHYNYWHFLRETGMSGTEFHVWMTTYDQVKQTLAEDYEMEDIVNEEDYDYWLECSKDAIWFTKHC